MSFENIKKMNILSWAFVGILVLTTLVFLPVLDNDLTNWDDPIYLNDNTLIQDLSINSIKKIFTNDLDGRYHPLTLLTYAIEYHWFGLTPRIYHLNNLLLHLANVILVFILAKILFQEQITILIITILFAIHPIHVEPVAWVTSRKDVLSAFFYLITLLTWIKHIQKTPQRWFYYLTFLNFILAVLAKASAVTIPLIFFLFDYYFKRPLNKKTIVEKVPFLLIAITLGSITWTSVETAHSFPNTDIFNIGDRLFLSLYAIFIYICKIFFPITISGFYPFPPMDGPWFPLSVYVACVFVVLGGWLLWQNRNRVNREIIFGICFFLIMILPVLHFIKINDSIVYDRFGYLSSLGIFLILANSYRYFTHKQFFEHLPIDTPRLARALCSVYLIYLSFFSWQHSLVWKNSLTFWSDVIYQFPECGLPYHNRVEAWVAIGRYDLALKDVSKSILLDPTNIDSRLNRGRVYVFLKAYDLALMDFSYAIRMMPENPEGYLERGNILLYFKQYDLAIQDFTKNLSFNPRQNEAYINRGNAYFLKDQYDLALRDYTKALKIKTNDPIAYFNRATIYLIREEKSKAMQDLNAGLCLNPFNAQARKRMAEILN